MRVHFFGPKKKSKNATSGFTLIEMVVAVGLFAVLTSIAVGGFVRALRIQRQVSAVVAAGSNVNLAIEQLSRELRTGRFFCIAENQTANCPDPETGTSGTAVCFYNALNQTVVYEWDPVTKNIMRGIADDDAIHQFDPSNPGANLGDVCDNARSHLFAVTGDNVQVEHLAFQLFGTLPADEGAAGAEETRFDNGLLFPPRISITIGVVPRTADKEINTSPVNLQTTVSARLQEF